MNSYNSCYTVLAIGLSLSPYYVLLIVTIFTSVNKVAPEYPVVPVVPLTEYVLPPIPESVVAPVPLCLPMASGCSLPANQSASVS